MSKEQTIGMCVPAAPIAIFPAQSTCENLNNADSAYTHALNSAEHLQTPAEAIHEKFHGNILKDAFYGVGNLAGDAQKGIVDFFTPEEQPDHASEEIHAFMADINGPVNQVADAEQKPSMESLHDQYANENVALKGVHGIGNLGADLRKGVANIFSSDSEQVERFQTAHANKPEQGVERTYALEDDTAKFRNMA